MSRHSGQTALVVEDHPVMSAMLGEFLVEELGFEICGRTRNVEEALAAIDRSRPDLVLVDVSLPGRSGIDLVSRIHERWPDVWCLMLSGHEEWKYVRRSLEAGARGYALKGSVLEIRKAIEAVMAGEIYLSEAMRARMVSEQVRDTDE